MIIFSLVNKITELAEGVSSEDSDELQYLPPLKLLSLVAQHLTSAAISPPAMANKLSQTDRTDLKIFQSTESQTNKENETPGEKEAVQTVSSKSAKNIEPIARGSGSYFHPNIRVPPPPRPGLQPILPKPKFDSEKPSSQTKGTSKEADTPFNDNNFQERLSRDEIIHSTPSLLRERDRKKSKQSDDEFLNELLNLGQKIVSLLPENVSAENIPSKADIADIAKEGAYDEGIMTDFLNMFGESSGRDDTRETSEDVDSRVNTPVTSPVPDFKEGVDPPAITEPEEILEVLPVADDEVPGDQSKGFDASLSVTHVDSNVMDILGRVVNETINVVTRPIIKQNFTASAPAEPPVTKNKRKRKTPKIGQIGQDVSKKVKKQEDVTDFRRKFRGVVSSVEGPSPPQEEKVTVPKENTDRKTEDLIFSLSSDILYSMRNGDNKPEIDAARERHISSEDINIIADPDFDKNIVVVVEEEGAKPEDSKRRGRCLNCPGCKAPPCNQCRPCKDKKVNGGPGTLKKGCINKHCHNLKIRKRRSSSKSKLEQHIENFQQEEISPSKHRGLSKPQQPYHVRTLQFSPRQGKQSSAGGKENVSQETSGVIKTLSPAKVSSPMKMTDEAWNGVENILRSSDSKDVHSHSPASSQSISGAEDKSGPSQDSGTGSEPNNPYLIKKDLAGLNQPEIIKVNYTAAAPQIIPALKHLIPPSALPPLPVGYKSLGFSVSQQNSSASLVKNAELPTEKSPGDKTDKNNDENIEIASELIEGKKETKSPENKISSKKSSKGIGSKKSLSVKSKAWDETLRATLGSAEKDMSHLTHKLTEKEKKVRKRSPKKIIYDETPDSDDEESPAELVLTDANIAPEAQKILDTFANQLLGKMEEAVEKNLLKPTAKEGSSTGKADEGKNGTLRERCMHMF